MTPPRPTPATDPRHRRVPESQVLDMLVLSAWLTLVAEARHDLAVRRAGLVLDNAVALGLGFARTSKGERLFDPVEVDHFVDWAGQIGADTLWFEGMEATNAALVDAARPSRVSEGTAFEIRFRRTFNHARLTGGLTTRLRAPIALACPYHQTVSVQAVTTSGFAADGVQARDRLEFRVNSSTPDDFTVGVDLRLVARTPAPASAAALAPDQARLYLRAQEGMVQVTPRILGLARRIAGKLQPREAVKALWFYLEEHYRFRWVRYDEAPADAVPDWVLGLGYYDCNLCSIVLVSLCRALDIPARVVRGHYLYPLSPTNHSWVEIWLDEGGWTPFDLLHRERDRPEVHQDLDWWRHFAVRRERRMVTEQPPRLGGGPSGARWPASWQMLHAGLSPGVLITFEDVTNGALILRDEVIVRVVPPIDDAGVTSSAVAGVQG